MVTAELALAFLAAAAVLVMLSWGVFLITIQLRCIDTAAAVARQTARNDTAAASAGQSQAPRGALVHIQRTPALITVEVRIRVGAFRWTTGGAGGSAKDDLGAGLGSVELHAVSSVAPEPGR